MQEIFTEQICDSLQKKLKPFRTQDSERVNVNNYFKVLKYLLFNKFKHFFIQIQKIGSFLQLLYRNEIFRFKRLII